MSSTHSYPAPASVFFLYYYDHNVWLSTGSDVFFSFSSIPPTPFDSFPPLFIPNSISSFLLSLLVAPFLLFCIHCPTPPRLLPSLLICLLTHFPPLCSCLIFWVFLLLSSPLLSFRCVPFYPFCFPRAFLPHLPLFPMGLLLFFCSFSLLPFSFVSLLCHTIGSPHLLSLLTLSLSPSPT